MSNNSLLSAFLVFALAAFGLAHGEEPAPSVRLSLKSGTTVEGTRLEFSEGKFVLFQSGRTEPLRMNFEEVLRVQVLESARVQAAPTSTVPEAPPEGVPSARDVGAPETPPDGQKEPSPLLPLPVPDFSSLRLEELEAAFMDERHLGPRALVFRAAVLSDQLEARGELDAAIKRYRGLLAKTSSPSIKDMKLRFLLIICLDRCLDRAGDREAYEKEAKEFRRLYPQETEVLRDIGKRRKR